MDGVSMTLNRGNMERAWYKLIPPPHGSTPTLQNFMHDWYGKCIILYYVMEYYVESMVTETSKNNVI